MSPKKIAPVDIEGIEHVSAPANRVLAQVAQSIASRKEQDNRRQVKNAKEARS